jgi:iron complex transport system substrate-binding protein
MRRRGFLAGAAALLVAPAAAIDSATAAAAPQRIVSIGGAITEIVFALGEGAQVAAVDTTSLYPAAATALPKVGYLRQLATEGILALKPDLILADADAGPPNVLDQLQRMGTPLRHFTGAHAAASIAPKIRFVGAALARTAEAERMAIAFTADLAAVDAAVKPLPRPKVLFVMAAGANGLRGAGRGTAAAEVIARAGAVNAFDAVEGYKPISPEAGLTADPDCLLMMTQTLQALGGAPALAALPGLAHLRAVRDGRILAFDGDYLLGLGPRTAHALRGLAAKLHPDAALPALPARPWTA